MKLPRWLSPKIMIVILAVLFLFLAPVVPTTVATANVLPGWNEQKCPTLGSVPPLVVEPAFGSISYVLLQTAGHVIYGGAFGLVVVPGNGWYSVQFPPVGFKTIMCL